MRSGMLVDVEYLARLENMYEELHQARVADGLLTSCRHLRAALLVAEEVADLLEGEISGIAVHGNV